MKKTFYYMSLLLGLFFGMTMFTACGGGDDDNGGTSGGGEGGFVPGKFMGPKRVFGDNLLSSFGPENGSQYEITYNSDNFVSKLKRINSSSNTEYDVTYSDNQVIITRNSSGGTKQYTITIGSNGFAQTVDWGDGEITTYEYDSEGHVTRFTTIDIYDSEEYTYVGTLTWQNGNMIVPSDNDSGRNSTITVSYNSTPNVAGLYVRANIGGDVGDFYDDILYYMGLLGKGTANLVQSYSYSSSSSSSTSENAWTLDDAGRPTKCVTTTTYTSGGGSTSTRTYYWNYR